MLTLRDRSLIKGRGGGATEREGGASHDQVLPLLNTNGSEVVLKWALEALAKFTPPRNQ